MRGPTNPPDATMRLLDHLAEGGEGEVGKLATLALEAGPHPFYRVEVGCVGGEALDPQPVPLAGDKRLHLLAAVGGQAVPEQGDLLPAEEAEQLAEDGDLGGGFVDEGLAGKRDLRPAAAHAVAQRRGH